MKGLCDVANYSHVLRMLQLMYLPMKPDWYAREMIEIAIARLVIQRVVACLYDKDNAFHVECRDLGFYDYNEKIAIRILEHYQRFSSSVIKSAVKVDTPQPDWSQGGGLRGTKPIHLDLGNSPDNADLDEIGAEHRGSDEDAEGNGGAEEE